METIDLFFVEIYGDGRFYPGEVIYGDVYLKTNDELTLREIRIEFYGEAKVFWAEATRTGRIRKRLGMRDYTNYEQYLNIAATVYGKGKHLLHTLNVLTGAFRFVLGRKWLNSSNNMGTVDTFDVTYMKLEEF